MASVVIVTDLFRASHVHLKEPHKFQEKDDAKYRMAMMFPQSGVGEIAASGVPPFAASCQSIIDAIYQVTMEEFGFAYDPFDETVCKQMGIQFPPVFKDGNCVSKKDQQGFPIPGQFEELTAGYYILNTTAKADEQPGVVEGRNNTVIDPGAVYSGCWCRAQLEISAYVTKQTTPARIIVVKLLNVMMCYDDTSFGGRGPAPRAENAFAGYQVEGCNLAADTGRQNFTQMTNPPAAPPARPGAPASVPTTKLVMNQGVEYTYEQLSKEYGWTDAEIVEGGYATMQVVTPPPARPGPAAGPARPGPAAGPARPGPAAGPARPGPVAPPAPVKSVPTTGQVIMNVDSEYTYEQLTQEYGYSDQDIIAAGYGVPNFTNPQ